jgi:tRNA-modifying protein YgfZ
MRAEADSTARAGAAAGPAYNRAMSTTLPELDAQYRLMREECGLLVRTGHVVLELRGEEGAELLQGQLTNDIEALEPGRGCYAALLDRKGKMRADMRVLRLAPDLIWIEGESGCIETVAAHLGIYRVGREVELATRDDLVVLSLLGPRSAALLGSAPLGTEHDHATIAFSGAEPRWVATDAGADLIFPAASLEPVRAALVDAGAEPVDERAAEILRVEAGRPRFGAEMGPDTIPQEAGLNERAVSFEKGCYIGQETVARLHYKGKPNRHLRRLRSERELAEGSEVRVGDKTVGRVGTAVLSPAEGPIALAILRREAEPGAEVSVGEQSARVEEVGA